MPVVICGEIVSDALGPISLQNSAASGHSSALGFLKTEPSRFLPRAAAERGGINTLTRRL